MEDIKLGLPRFKTVKKITFNEVINKSHLNLNRDSSPLKIGRGIRSQSFKTIANFVPKLKPLKSSFIPVPLRLNNETKHLSSKGKEKEDINKQMSDDENDYDEDSSSSISSSDIDSSEEDSLEIKIKEKDKEDEIVDNNNSNNINEKIGAHANEKADESDEDNYDDLYINHHKYSNESWYKNNCDINKNIKSLRKKMSKIRVRVGISKFKETEEVIRDNFKNNFGIGLNKYEKDNELSLYSSVNILENKENIKPKIRSIFEVISISKNILKK